MKLGLIGCGQVAVDRHLPVLKSFSDVEVVAVAEIDSDRLKRVAERFQVRHRHTDYRNLLEQPEIEAVAVCVPLQVHSETAVAVLEAGKHLLIEKPLAMNLDECDRLIEQAARSPGKAMVGLNLRWHRLVRQARAIVQRGELGPLKLMRSEFVSGSQHRPNFPEWSKHREQGGGVLIETATHHVDLWRFLLQSEVDEIFATSRSERFDDDSAAITARMSNGVLASAIFSQGTSQNQAIEIFGQAGRLGVSCYRFDGLEYTSAASFPGDAATRLRGMVRTLTSLPQGALGMRRGGDVVDSFRAMWRHFIDAIEQDTAVECTLEDGRQALQIVLAALHSSVLGQAINVVQAPGEISPINPDNHRG